MRQLLVLCINVTRICLCLSLICLTCLLFADLVLTDVSMHKQNQACVQCLQVTTACVFGIVALLSHPCSTVKKKKAQTQGCAGTMAASCLRVIVTVIIY